MNFEQTAILKKCGYKIEGRNKNVIKDHLGRILGLQEKEELEKFILETQSLLEAKRIATHHYIKNCFGKITEVEEKQAIYEFDGCKIFFNEKFYLSENGVCKELIEGKQHFLVMYVQELLNVFGERL